ncbi:MAG: serine/threonine-protein kinase [Planctomycetaceae bacterium]
MSEPAATPNESSADRAAPQPDAVSNSETVMQRPGGGGGAGEPIRHFAEGEMLGEFKLLKKLGQGDMATVWLAEQTSLHRNVALKLLRSDLMADATYVKRFQTEAKAAAGLNHPNIVQVYVIGEADGQHFIAQEYVQGSTLKGYLQKKGTVDLNLGLHLMRQVGAALQTAAEQGIVHRDIKPENIMLNKKGEAKVADFGLAQLTQGGEKLNLTQEGVTMGTPLYMSPEQVQGIKLDARSDIYSFGVTCYHLFCGRPPFQGETALGVAVQHLQNEPPPLKELRPELPQPVCDLIHRMMRKDPAERYPDAATVLEDVRKLIRAVKEEGRIEQVQLTELTGASRAPRTFAARRPILTLTLLTLLTLGGSAALGWWMRPPDPRQVPPSADYGIAKSDPRQMYLQAVFNGQEEDGWLALIHHWDGRSEGQEWVARAHEQLALLYLRERDRWNDAERQLDELKSQTGPLKDVAYTKARIGEAVLAANRGSLSGAKEILNQLRANVEQHGLDKAETGGTWAVLLREVRDRIDQAP